jgi:hypothetical protein
LKIEVSCAGNRERSLVCIELNLLEGGLRCDGLGQVEFFGAWEREDAGFFEFRVLEVPKLDPKPKSWLKSLLRSDVLGCVCPKISMCVHIYCDNVLGTVLHKADKDDG